MEPWSEDKVWCENLLNLGISILGVLKFLFDDLGEN
jgi:hypothetical protein